MMAHGTDEETWVRSYRWVQLQIHSQMPMAVWFMHKIQWLHMLFWMEISNISLFGAWVKIFWNLKNLLRCWFWVSTYWGLRVFHLSHGSWMLLKEAAIFRRTRYLISPTFLFLKERIFHSCRTQNHVGLTVPHIQSFGPIAFAGMQWFLKHPRSNSVQVGYKNNEAQGMNLHSSKTVPVVPPTLEPHRLQCPLQMPGQPA